MKINCEIVQDLLPLYADGVCSPSSRAAVEEHLKTCDNCRKMKEGAATVPETEVLLESSEQDAAAAGSFKKVRRRWGISLIAILLVIPLLLMTVNQIRGAGICFTNLDDIYVAKRFVSYLEQGEYEKAAAMYDFSWMYDDVMGALERPVEDYMENNVPIQIGGETWYVDPGFLDAVQLSEEPRVVWSQLIYNDRGLVVMVPERVWEEIVVAGDMVCEQIGNGYELSNNRVFYSMDTPWGTYYLSDTAYQYLASSEKRTIDYAICSYILPETMYQDLYPDILAYATSMYESNQALYGGAAGMSEKEFEDYMRRKYADELRSGFEDVTVCGNSFHRAYHGGTMWSVSVQTELTYQGETVEYWIDPFIRDGRLAGIGTMGGKVRDWLDAVSEALHAGFVY